MEIVVSFLSIEWEDDCLSEETLEFRGESTLGSLFSMLDIIEEPSFLGGVFSFTLLTGFGSGETFDLLESKLGKKGLFNFLGGDLSLPEFEGEPLEELLRVF